MENPPQWEETVDNLWLDVYNKLPVDSYLGRFEALDGYFECIPVLTAVGCPYSCIYCPYPVGYGKKMVHKSVSKTIEEIKYLKEQFGISGFVFRAQNFTYDQRWVSELCDTLIRERLDVHWLAETRADLVSEKLLWEMKDAGCFRIHYGVETGAPEMERIGKPGLGISRIKEVFRITKELEIFTMAHMIIGLPGENRRTLKETTEILIALDPDVVNINIVTPYPGTKLFEAAKTKGLIETYDYSKYTSYDPVMRTEHLSIEELKKARRKMKNRFIKYKLLRDSGFRRRYLKSLPRKIKSRVLGYGAAICGNNKP